MSNVEKLHKEPPAPEASGPHVFVAIAAVMDELAGEGIGKNRSNQQQNYRFRGIDDVHNALAPVLAKHHLIVLPRGLGRTVTERQTKQGGNLFFVNVEMEYDFISAIDGSKTVVGPMYGEAMDSADKATNKAQSAAYKYMAIQAFCIPVEGQPDADSTTHDLASAEQQAIAHLNACSISAETFKQAWTANKDGWKDVLDLAAYKRVVAEMKRIGGEIKERQDAEAKTKTAEPKEAPPHAPSDRADEHRRADAAETDPFDDQIPF